DGHLDVNTVRAGAVIICPVKVRGGGVYMGDMHAFQGNGEIAGHTADVSGLVTLQVRLIKGLSLDGPILLPLEEDLPHLARPVTSAERKSLEALAGRWGTGAVEEDGPVCFIGTGANMNAAIDNSLERAAAVLDMTIEEVKNRVTIAGAIEIGRAPGVVMTTFRCPVEKLEQAGIMSFVRQQYDL
ncbi:MAG: acetamidase/formamidase family protein, partial [Aminivibrio sp.]